MGCFIPFAATAIEKYTDSSMALSEKLSIGAEVAVIGILVVFAVLAILWGCLELFRVFFYDIPNKKKAAKAVSAPVPETQVDIPTEPEPEEDTGALIAAITAAISVATEMPQSGFRVVSFRKALKK